MGNMEVEVHMIAFEKPEIEVIKFECDNIIVTSGGHCGREDGGCNDLIW